LLERASSVYYEQDESGSLFYSKPPAHGSKEERIIGTLTAFPIIETKENDFSAYIPTNVISITDGQIYLDNNLFNEEILPAVHTGLSVSRVGGAAQTTLMKKLSKNLKADLAVFKEKKKYESFGFDLSPEDKNILTHGKRVYRFLKQPLNSTEEEKNQLIDLIKNEVLKLTESEFLGFKISQKHNEPADVFGFKEIESLNSNQVLEAAFERYSIMYGLVLKDGAEQKAIDGLKKAFQASGFADYEELRGIIVTNGDMLNTITDILNAYNKTD
jgi:F0F1-type ATP synthase alpha subunit